MEGDTPKPPIEMREVSETVRVYSTAWVRGEWATNIISGIKSNRLVRETNLNDNEPTLYIEVEVSDPQYWDSHVDPHYRRIIEAAIEGHCT